MCFVAQFKSALWISSSNMHIRPKFSLIDMKHIRRRATFFWICRRKPHISSPSSWHCKVFKICLVVITHTRIYPRQSRYGATSWTIYRGYRLKLFLYLVKNGSEKAQSFVSSVLSNPLVLKCAGGYCLFLPFCLFISPHFVELCAISHHTSWSPLCRQCKQAPQDSPVT
jgi:hypothetical protein